jgi:protein-disulfide isomerase
MRLPRMLAAIPAALLLGTGVSAQAPPQAPPAMSQQQINEEMLKELRQIRQILERISQPQQPAAPPQPTTAKITNLKGFVMGRPDAPLTMIEFTDLQCPFCRQYVTTTFDEIKKNWIDTGKLRYISRDFPLDFHPQAMPAARAALCAGDQGKFWELRYTLMRNANLLSSDYINRTAADLKLDTKAFASCIASTKFDAEIQAEMQEGTRIGVTGTPTFVIGKTAATVVEGPMIVGALPYGAFDARLKDVLAK